MSRTAASSRSCLLGAGILVLASCTAATPSDAPAPDASPAWARVVGQDSGTIWIRLLDGEGKPVTDVAGSIELSDMRLAVRDDERPGEIHHTSIPPGTHRVRIVKDGFLPANAVVLVVAGRVTHLELRLEAGEFAIPPAPALAVSDVLGSTADALTVAQATRADPGSEVTVKGFLIRDENGVTRLCTDQLTSDPPVCGKPSVVVTGLRWDGLDGVERSHGRSWRHDTVLRGVIATTAEGTGNDE